MKSKKAISLPDENSIDDEELPEGWEIKKIKDITKKVPTVKPESAPEKIFGYVDIGSINNKTNQIFDFKKIRGEEAPSRARQSIQPNDVLFSNVRTYLRNIAIVPDDLDVQVCSTGFTVLRSNGSIDPKFLFYFTITDGFINQVTPQQTGSQYPATTDRVVKDATISFPPLAEQKRIVARVEALLTHINAARDRLSRVPLIMKKFRQAVLAAACSGRLTQEWRESCGDIEPSTELFSKMQKCISLKYFESCENAKKTGGRKTKDERKNKKSEKPVIDLPELPEIWNYYRLEDLSHLITDGTHVTPEYIEKGIPFLSSRNIRPFFFRLDNIKLISLEEHQLINQRCNPELHDILYTKVGSYGYAVQNKLDYPFSLFVSVALIKPVKEYFTPDYAEIVMNSPIVFEQANDRISGSGTPDLHLIEIRDFRIPLPPLAEQHEIVRRVGMLFERADAIDREVAAAGRRCERLTQAVLARAFAGKL